VPKPVRPNRGRLGRLVAWHLSSGPVGSPAMWAATSNFEVGQMTYHVNRGRIGRIERAKGARDEVKKRKRGKERVERGGGQEPLSM